MTSRESTTRKPRIEFGIKTTPLGVSFEELAAFWREADALAAIDHAWLWDHLMPLRGDPSASALEGWTTLAGLAALTSRLRLGLIVTNNLIRNPALLAKMAATVDQLSGGRLEFGIGAGGNLERESAAFDLPAPAIGERVLRLEESCKLIKLLWGGEPVDFKGRFHTLEGGVCAPTPIQLPRPPLVIGGAGERLTLPLVARHADVWNVPGPPYLVLADFERKSNRLAELCAEIGRIDEPTRSVQITVDPSEPARTVETAREWIAAGAGQLILAVGPPYDEGLAARLCEEIIAPLTA
jgi:alkanesulfonate monooxygenase SsuD/methylene tetrahydromethanopterin reductase-like flavin-dependent oxidoreductase (luciferase family)